MSTSDLKQFEQQLKNINQQKPNDLQAFEQQLKGVGNQKPQMNLPGVQQQGNVKTIQVTKNLVVSFASDASGCGHIRNIFPLSYLNSIFGKSSKLLTLVSPVFIFQQDILARAKAIYFQRQMTPQHKEIIQHYKNLQPNLKYKMVWEIDDYIWEHNEDQGGDKEHGVPSYNFGSKNISDEIKKTSVEIMNMMDEITVSTQPLKDFIKDVLGVKVPITVLQNTIPSYFWGMEKKEHIKEKIKKPRVIYTGSPTHYMNPIYDQKTGEQIQKAKLGDFDNAWKDWVIKSVNEGKIDFVCMGGLPWFFEEIKDKITIVGWVDSFRYHLAVKEQKADFGIMPLTYNMFNQCKSDIKAIEHYADGVVCFGTTFSNGKPSPYDNNPLTLPDNCTVEDIDRLFDKYCKPENYNKILDLQYDKLYNEGRLLESPDYVNKLVEIFMK